METLILIIGIIVILACVGAIFVACRNYVLIKEIYVINRRCRALMDLCNHFVRPVDSFRRKNNGDDPCEVTESIPYVDYVGNSNIFYKE